MAAGFAEPIDVESRDACPTSFRWRGRVYRVQGVLAHWLETGPLWQSASVRGLLASDVPGVTDESSAGGREFWQVEAVRPRQQVPGVYELCFDWSHGQPGNWSLTTTGAAGGAAGTEDRGGPA
ncbi:MAG: hypothetical protein GEV07_23080 [Streptosporangiales bacterium]|nr:hypothetical protein [Streptosporangiales bacterium]